MYHFLGPTELIKKPEETKAVNFLPCPFCGNREIYIAEQETDQFTMTCEDCAAHGPVLDYEDQAERAWNERK